MHRINVDHIDAFMHKQKHAVRRIDVPGVDALINEANTLASELAEVSRFFPSDEIAEFHAARANLYNKKLIFVHQFENNERLSTLVAGLACLEKAVNLSPSSAVMNVQFLTKYWERELRKIVCLFRDNLESSLYVNLAMEKLLLIRKNCSLRVGDEELASFYHTLATIYMEMKTALPLSDNEGRLANMEKALTYVHKIEKLGLSEQHA